MQGQPALPMHAHTQAQDKGGEWMRVANEPEGTTFSTSRGSRSATDVRMREMNSFVVLMTARVLAAMMEFPTIADFLTLRQ